MSLLSGAVDVDVWECGGKGEDWAADDSVVHPDYMERKNEEMFGNVSCLVYILDAGSKTPEADLITLETNVSLLRQYSPDASFHVLLHKSDEFHSRNVISHHSLSSHSDELRLKEAEIRRRALPTLTECFITTIWDESLFRAWSSILSPLILSSSTINSSLLVEELSRLLERSKADEVVIYEAQTILMLTHVGRRAAFMDNRRFERISNILRRIRECTRKVSAFPCNITAGWGEGSMAISLMGNNAAYVVLVGVKEDRMEELGLEVDAFKSTFDAVFDSSSGSSNALAS